tara:strand:+ start:339 stop:602 length:264 start_codon:yes stop_codon:yes gene_type:complete
VYVIELALKLSPFPLSVQRKEFDDAQSLYNQIRDSMLKETSSLLELTCEKIDKKKIAVLTGELLAVQIYEKTTAVGGAKRPGFSFDS